MKWLAIVQQSDGSVVHCSFHKTGLDASAELAEYRRKTGVGFGTRFIIAQIEYCIEE